MHRLHTAPTPAMFAGAGQAGQTIAAIDWRAHPLGTPEQWPHSLRTLVAALLHSRHPMFLWWGEELWQFYNDAYLPSFDPGRHPAAMGQRGADCWHDAWDLVYPQIRAALDGHASWDENRLVPILRAGRLEEVYWTYSYSPAFGDDGRVAGVLVACVETTATVVSGRRERTLRRLAEASLFAAADTPLTQLLHETLDDAALDFPFWLLLRPAGGQLAVLDAAPGVRERAPQIAAALRLPASAGGAEGALLTLDAPLDVGPWPEPVGAVHVAKLDPAAGADGALLVLGLSPRQRLDHDFTAHIDYLRRRVTAADRRLAELRASAAAERERDNLLLNAPVGTALFKGPEHVICLANRRYRQMVGREDLVGRRYVDAFPELARTPLPALLDRAYREGRAYVTEECEIHLDADGDGQPEQRFFRFNLEPMRGDGGAVWGMMAVAFDVTEQVLARRSLERSAREREMLLQQASAASHAKDEFLAVLGHELRNPLSPILTALSLMRMKRPGETTEHEQRIIERQTRHMVRLVDDLLDISRITRGVVALGRQRVDVAAVVAQAIETTSPLLESKRQRLALDVTPGLAIDADPDRIAQVIGNLLNNASRYSPPGACVHVSAHGPGESVVIEVRDEGEGLPPGAAEAIFEPFMQLDRSVSGARGGLGLGLAISRRLIELHGGVIRAHSDGPGRGSRFAVELPRVAAAAEPDEPVTVSMHAMMAPRSVLIVDDNEDAADTLADLLRTLGHQVQVAHDPPAALAVAEAFSPDIALLDIGLPVMDGYALAARLRERWSHGCKFVAVTGYGTSDDRRRSAAAGFDAHLVKPASLSDVLDALGEARGAACA